MSFCRVFDYTATTTDAEGMVREGREIADIFSMTDLDTKIIAASIRNPIHVTDCALAGVDIATVPRGVIEQRVKHPLTGAGIAKFQADYRAVFDE